MSLGVNVDFDRVVELARSWRAEAVLARAFRLAWEILGLDQAADAASRIRSLRPRTSELKALEAYLPPQRSYVGLCLATVKVIRRPSEKIRYVASLALPQRDFVTPRYGGHTDRWRRATRVLRSRRSPAG
jgi:hypothetical protein